jgi:hypothetical protein
MPAPLPRPRRPRAHPHPRSLLVGPLLALLVLSPLAACGPSAQGGPRSPSPEAAVGSAGVPGVTAQRPPARPIPYPIEVPNAFEAAIERGTRTATGEPGPGYWQQWADYVITARLDTDARRLHGRAEIVYRNNSPDVLAELHVDLHQNLHAPGVVRFEPAEVTGGVDVRRVAVDGREAATPGGRSGAVGATGAGSVAQPRYAIAGTRMVIVPPSPVQPGASVRLELDWSFAIPQAGAGARMGWHRDDLFFLAYWYPQMTAYDDVVGWHPDPFIAMTEFHSHFASYDVTLDVPAQWIVQGTGRSLSWEENLAPEVLERLRRAQSSDTVVTIVGPADFGRATRPGTDGRLQWRFQADTARDMAFSATRASRWDAARTPVGDRTGDGATDHTVVHSFWRETAPLWREMTRYQQHAIAFLSDYTGLPYPWPHMTAVEGGGIIGGGMEFPMMTLIGDYNTRGDTALYAVTAHELAHMWIPMIVSSDERRYSWLDEGHTTFHTAEAVADFFPGADFHALYRAQYLAQAGTDGEVEILRRSAYMPPGAFFVSQYRKPSSVLVALRALIGEEAFAAAHQEFIRRWSYRIPYPWDFFRTVEDVSGHDLWWFWRAWYAETWVLDQAIAAVEPVPAGEAGAGGTRIVVEDRGQVPMPVRLTVTRADGSVARLEIPVDAWLPGARLARVTMGPGAAVTRVEIDAERVFPDVDRSNNVWPR